MARRVTAQDRMGFRATWAASTSRSTMLANKRLRALGGKTVHDAFSGNPAALEPCEHLSCNRYDRYNYVHMDTPPKSFAFCVLFGAHFLTNFSARLEQQVFSDVKG